MPPDRMTFAKSLEAALADSEPAQRVAELLCRVLVMDSGPWEADEQRLVREVAERIDSAGGDATRLIALARDVGRLLGQASSNHAVDKLLELVAERYRALSISRKYLEGKISRVAFLSYVTEQRWPSGVRRRISALSQPDLRDLMNALEHVDIAQLETILWAQP